MLLPLLSKVVCFEKRLSVLIQYVQEARDSFSKNFLCKINCLIKWNNNCHVMAMMDQISFTFTKLLGFD